MQRARCGAISSLPGGKRTGTAHVCRVSELVELCTAGEFMVPILGDGTERSQSTRLGKALQNARDRVFGEYRLEFAGRDSASKRPTYRVTHSSQQDMFGQRDDKPP